MLSDLFARGLAAKPVKLTLQLHNRFGDRSCLFPVHSQMLLGA
jgi:hypothetical protein